MSGGALLLLHSPLVPAEQSARLAADLERSGARCVFPEVGPADQPPYAARHVANVALRVGQDHGTGETLGIVARGAAGPLAPQVAAAQRAAGRHVASYVLLDALLPQQGTASLADLARAQSAPAEVLESAGSAAATADALRAEALPMVHDWPDAPCGYVLTDPRYASCARLAGLRGWSVTDLSDQRPDNADLARAVMAAHAELTA